MTVLQYRQTCVRGVICSGCSSERRSTTRSKILVRSSGGSRCVEAPSFRRFAARRVAVLNTSYNSWTYGEQLEDGRGKRADTNLRRLHLPGHTLGCILGSVDDLLTTWRVADLSWRIFPLADVIASLTYTITAGGTSILGIAAGFGRTGEGRVCDVGGKRR